MLNEQIMTDTVLRLLDAGIDDATIISTLVDAGVSNEEALVVIKKVKDKSASPQSPAPEQQALSSDVKLLKTQLETQAEQHDLHETTTSNILDDHEDRISNISDQIQEVKSTVEKTAVVDPGVSYRLGEIETKLSEVNAKTTAVLDLLQKILDNNRKILTDLEAVK
ncbi:MAG: hypothetical protein WCI04_05415 [archaeon]